MATGQAQIGGEIFEVTDGDLQVRPMGGTIVNIDSIDAGGNNFITAWINWCEIPGAPGAD